MNFTRKSRQSTVKHEVKSKFRRFANNFCRKNTGFSVDFHFFDDKNMEKHVYFTVSTRPKRRKHDKTHGFERKKLQIREFSVETRSLRQGPPRTPAKRQYVNPLAGVEPQSLRLPTNATVRVTR